MNNLKHLKTIFVHLNLFESFIFSLVILIGLGFALLALPIVICFFIAMLPFGFITKWLLKRAYTRMEKKFSQTKS